jgi:hypothetical protein
MCLAVKGVIRHVMLRVKRCAAQQRLTAVHANNMHRAQSSLLLLLLWPLGQFG